MWFRFFSFKFRYFSFRTIWIWNNFKIVINSFDEKKIVQHFIENCFILSKTNSNVVNLNLINNFINRAKLFEILKKCEHLIHLFANNFIHNRFRKRHLWCLNIVIILINNNVEHFLKSFYFVNDWMILNITKNKRIDCFKFKNLRKFKIKTFMFLMFHDQNNFQFVIDQSLQFFHFLIVWYEIENFLMYKKNFFEFLKISKRYRYSIWKNLTFKSIIW